MPSPLGEGQTDMPINHLNQDEVITARIEKISPISCPLPSKNKIFIADKAISICSC